MTYDERDRLQALLPLLDAGPTQPLLYSDLYDALAILIRDAVDRSRE